MATKAITNVDRGHGFYVVTWEGLTSGDEGAAYEPPSGYDLESMQFFGTFDGGTAKVQGTNEATPLNWSDIEATGATAAAIIAPDEQTRYFRPSLSGGLTEDVDALALFRQRN